MTPTSGTGHICEHIVLITTACEPMPGILFIKSIIYAPCLLFQSVVLHHLCLVRHVTVCYTYIRTPKKKRW